MNLEEYLQKCDKLKEALLEYSSRNGRHYGDLSRPEQAVEDLIQALNTRIDLLTLALRQESRGVVQAEESPRDRLASRFLETGALLAKGGKVDAATVDAFEETLDAFDRVADLRREADSVQDRAETSIIKHKRERSK